MATSASNDFFAQKLCDQQKEDLWTSFFGDTDGIRTGEVFDNYFKHGYNSILLAQRGGYGHDSKEMAQLATQNQEDITRVVEVLKKNPNQTKDSLIKEVKDLFSPDTPDNAVLRTIAFTVRVWLFAGSFSSPARLDNWNEGTSLAKFLKSLFPEATSVRLEKPTVFEADFTVASMNKYCDLGYEFTSNLEEHLTLYKMGCRRTLRIFQHKACLSAHLKNLLRDEIIPASVLQDTISSLNLLFPYGDNDTRELLRNHPFDIVYENPVPEAEYQFRDTDEFGHWRRRLTILHDQVYLKPASSWRQLWKDTRYPQLYWTFWTAFAIFAITIFATTVTVVQTVYSALAYYKG